MHDEEDTVDAFHARTIAALDGIEFELVIVDDGSRDATGERLRALAAADERVKLVTLSRNFGHQAALSAGLEHARGDVVVMIDGDLQDPPELIPEMLAAWRGGADVVYAVRESREGETRFKLATRALVLPAVRQARADRARPGLGRLPAAWTARRSTRCSRCPSATASCAG